MKERIESDVLPWSPAAERNAAPILDALRPRLSRDARVLEIGAGTGQHAVAFSHALAGVRWLPTEQDSALAGLSARVAAEGGPDLEAPRALDVTRPDWPPGPFDAVYSANTAHIMPWPAVQDLVAGAARVLRDRGCLFLYGPFRRPGIATAPSNERFDRSLRARDPDQGLRDLDELESVALRHHLELVEVVALPANNLFLHFERRESRS